MAAIRELYLTSLFVLFSQISGQQSGNSTIEQCGSSNLTIVFNFSLGGENFYERSWYLNSTVDKIAAVNSTGFLTVEPPYSSRFTLSGTNGITLSRVSSSDSGSYLFIILTDTSYTYLTATTTVIIIDTPDYCIPVTENNIYSITCKIPAACRAKNSLQARWNNTSTDVLTCPSTITKPNCCAVGDPVTKCYNTSLCTVDECEDNNNTGNDRLYLLFLLLLLIPIPPVIYYSKRKEKENLRVSIDIGEELLRKHGSDVKIICSNDGPGNINIDWIGPQRERLTTSGKCTITEYDGKTKKSSLTIAISSITDCECYICRAWKKSGASAEAYIKFRKHDKDLFTVGIDEVKCSVPVSASAEWLGPKLNKLTDAVKYNIVSHDSKTKESSFTIKTLSANDSGSYTCQAANSSQSSAKNSITITAENPNTDKESEKPTVQRVNRVRIIHNEESGKPRRGSRSDVSRRDVEIQMEENGVKSNEARPLVNHNRIGNKDDLEAEQVLSKPFDLKERRPLPPLNKEVKDKPTHHPQSIPSEKNDVKDKNPRGLSANFDDTQGLASETTRPIKLPPIEYQVQSTVQEEGTSEEPKKTKKNRKKKEKTDEGKHADETAK